jgi:hypothetical protein
VSWSLRRRGLSGTSRAPATAISAPPAKPPCATPVSLGRRALSDGAACRNSVVNRPCVRCARGASNLHHSLGIEHASGLVTPREAHRCSIRSSGMECTSDRGVPAPGAPGHQVSRTCSGRSPSSRPPVNGIIVCRTATLPADVNGSRFQPSRRSFKGSPTILPGREVDALRHGHGCETRDTGECGRRQGSVAGKDVGWVQRRSRLPRRAG